MTKYHQIARENLDYYLDCCRTLHGRLSDQIPLSPYQVAVLKWVAVAMKKYRSRVIVERLINENRGLLNDGYYRFKEW